ALIFTVAAAALNLIYGFTGLLSFAQLGFWGIGGYATALTVVTFGGTFWWGLVWAALINAAIALVVGYPTLRTNRHAFVIVTLTFALLATLIPRASVQLTPRPPRIPHLPRRPGPSAIACPRPASSSGSPGPSGWRCSACSMHCAARASAAP